MSAKRKGGRVEADGEVERNSGLTSELQGVATQLSDSIFRRLDVLYLKAGGNASGKHDVQISRTMNRRCYEGIDRFLTFEHSN